MYKLKESEFRELEKTAKDLGIKTDWLYTVIYIESKHNTKAINPISGAVGLIQFMPSTLAGMGYTKDSVNRMDYEQQLKLVKEYLKKYKSKIKSLEDLYLTIFYPRAIGKNSEFVLGSEVSNTRENIIASQNSIYAKNGKVKKRYIKDYLDSIYQKLGFSKIESKLYSIGKKIGII